MRMCTESSQTHASRRSKVRVMKEFISNVANLIKVKTVVTFAVIAVFCVLALRGTIPQDNVMIIVSSVVSFYFGTQHEKEAK